MTGVESRLWADYDELLQYSSKLVTWHALDKDPAGRRPPIRYLFTYHVRGIIDGSGTEPLFHDYFEVELDLSPPYPTSKARAKFTTTPIWHPNVHPDGRVCYEDRRIPGVGISPARICEIIGMMIAYQLYGRRHEKPIRTDEVFWRQFEKHRYHYPTDRGTIRESNHNEDESLIEFG